MRHRVSKSVLSAHASNLDLDSHSPSRTAPIARTSVARTFVTRTPAAIEETKNNKHNKTQDPRPKIQDLLNTKMIRLRNSPFTSHEMDRALDLLSRAIKKSDILMAVAPIRYISFGGAVSVKVFQSRESTEDIDILLDPSVESVAIYHDEIRRAISAAATKGNYESDWFSDACRLFIAEAKRPKLFQKSLQQNVVLYKSESLVIYAASFDCALERKLRRLDSNLVDRDHSIDLSDAVSLVHALRRAHPLRKDYVQSLDLNECRVPIQTSLVDLVASEYFLRHHQLGIVEMTWHEETQCYTYTNQKGEVSFVPRYLNSLNDERDARNNAGYVFTFK